MSFDGTKGKKKEKKVTQHSEGNGVLLSTRKLPDVKL